MTPDFTTTPTDDPSVCIVSVLLRELGVTASFRMRHPAGQEPAWGEVRREILAVMWSNGAGLEITDHCAPPYPGAYPAAQED